MNTFNKIYPFTVFSFLIFSLFFSLPVSAGGLNYADPPVVVHHDLDIAELIEWLESENPENDRQIVDSVREALNDRSDTELLQDLFDGLTVDQLKRLYYILIKADDEEWTLYFSEELWQTIRLKIKLESPVMYANPRISLILHFPGSKHFSMMLTDGSSWNVADHLTGDDYVDRLIITDLLGQYAEVEEYSQDAKYTYRISVLGFPEIRPAAFMLANPAEIFPADGQDVFDFGNLY